MGVHAQSGLLQGQEGRLVMGALSLPASLRISAWVCCLCWLVVSAGRAGMEPYYLLSCRQGPLCWSSLSVFVVLHTRLRSRHGNSIPATVKFISSQSSSAINSLTRTMIKHVFDFKPDSQIKSYQFNRAGYRLEFLETIRFRRAWIDSI